MSGVMWDPRDPQTPPMVGAICIVRVADGEVPLRTAYWCNGFWRNPHTAAVIVPEVLAYCPIHQAVLVLESCGFVTLQVLQALDGLAKRGVITPEQAEHAKRRIAEGGEA